MEFIQKLSNAGFFYNPTLSTMEIIILISAVIVALAIGFAAARFLDKKTAMGIAADAKTKAASIISEAEKEGESIKKDKILQAKEKFIELKAEHEKTIFSREKKITEAEKRIKSKEAQLSTEISKNKKLTE